MNSIGEFLSAVIFRLGEFEFTIESILELTVIFFLTRFLLRLYQVFIKKTMAEAQWLDKDRESRIKKAGKYLIIGFAVLTAFYRIGLDTVLDAIFNFSFFSLQDKVRFTVGNLIVLTLVLYASKFIANLLQLFIRQNMAKKGITDEGRLYTILKLTRYFLYVFAFIIAIQSLGMDMSLVLGGAAALLVGIGLGLQNLFNDIVSGFVLLFEGSLRVGDVIEINQLVAKVQQIDIRTSKVITRDGTYIIVPNSKLTSDNIVNWSHGSKLTRFNVKVHVALGSDTGKVRDILYSCAMKHPDVSKNREIIVRFDEFGESALFFNVHFWARKTWMVETLKSEIRFEIDRRFREEGIKIPFPQREMHFAKNQIPEQIANAAN